ncbi:MAG: hypothetical protein BWX91_01554 [Spirochaetes bacterium ADurb.Bin133]|jgi:hypothetical protein|nr:MAG: hypothetical protein BWX91_01554 [Spirochaetes bacterium ADurb.Bin133]
MRGIVEYMGFHRGEKLVEERILAKSVTVE